MGARERRKGHNYERFLVKDFKRFGFDAKTSRYASRIHDDCLIDLVDVPYHIQAKAVKGSVPYRKILYLMKQHIVEQEFDDLPSMIFHKRGRGEVNELVIMTKKDFYKIIGELYEKQEKE